MKYMARICVLLLCLCLVGCAGNPADDASGLTTASQPKVDGAALYAEAIAPVSDAKQLSYHVSANRQTTVGNATFSESTEQEITIDNGKCSVTEKAVYGNYTAEIAETYADGTAYATVSGNHFSSEITWDGFTSRFAPRVLLDSALYNTVTVSDDGTAISFSNPTGTEPWAADPSATVVTASGTVKLDSNGSYLSSTYEITYTLDAATITSTTTVTLSTDQAFPVNIPENTSVYTTLTDIDSIRMLERSYGYLTQSEYVTSVTQTSIMSQAVGLVRTQQTAVNTYEDMLSASQSVSHTNYSTGGETTTETVDELFRDGKYTSSVNGEAGTQNADITIDIMRNHCRELLTANIPDLNYITDVSLEDLGSLYLISFAGSEELGQAYCEEINYTLFQNKSFLNDLSTNYRTEAVSFYLGVDKKTNLPTACGIFYSGGHTINDIFYPLTLQIDQSFDLASLSAYEAITGESVPDTQPETDLTPLFYQVTGEDGRQMWLLGTIHVGDDRTAFLPEKITSAFQNSDALAVEFDTKAFEDRQKTDTGLQAIIAEAYYHGDGLAAHLTDPAFYAQAESLMKASGCYNYNTPYLRASQWFQSLENFYLRQSYCLSADKGMDARLLKQAREQGKAILEIESGEAQVQMLGSWSDALQEYLLKTTVNTDPAAHARSVIDLYEAWCLGNDAALTEALADDLSQLTDTEKLLYEEYSHSMITSRNTAMLEAAKTYLEGGDTVFYAVGLAHLLGENGLVNALRSEGYTVTQVLYE